MSTTTTRRPATEEKTPSTGSFTAGYRALTDALKTLALPTAGRKALPVLRRVLATVRVDHVELTTFDFEVAVTVRLPASDTSPGRMLLDHPSLAKILTAAVKGSTKAIVDQLDVTVATPDHTPVVHVAGYGLPLDDTVTVEAFPQLPPVGVPTHVVNREALTTLTERVTVAADRGETLPILTGLNTELDKASITMTATDRYRLAVGTVSATGTSRETVLIPAVVLSRLLPHLTSWQVRVGVDVVDGATWLTLADDDITVQIRTLDGDYPKVSSVVDQVTTRTVTLARTELLKAATRAAALSAAVTTKATPVRITVSPGELTIAPATDGEHSKVIAPTLPATTFGVDTAWTTGANPLYLLAAIATLADGEVTLHLGDPSRPIVLTDDGAAPYRHILMPARLAQ